ncbi:MAG: hypothetical protein MZV65_31590 [Chromatiales bacterium]|nr:hypothetical protein [Chromatiales bacterium]
MPEHYPELRPWLNAWARLLGLAATEAEGLTQGEDAARQEFLALAERLARAATLTWARAMKDRSSVESLIRLWPGFDAHLRTRHALRGVRRTIGRGGDLGVATSDRAPLLALTTDGQMQLATLSGDLLEAETLTPETLTRTLNLWTEEWVWLD